MQLASSSSTALLLLLQLLLAGPLEGSGATEQSLSLDGGTAHMRSWRSAELPGILPGGGGSCECAVPQVVDALGTPLLSPPTAIPGANATSPCAVDWAACASPDANITYDVVGGFAHMRFLGTDWYLVRRAVGSRWHAATDHLAGYDEYGTQLNRTDPVGGTESFSVAFGQFQWSEMLVASGDRSQWMVLTRRDMQPCSEGDGPRNFRPTLVAAATTLANNGAVQRGDCRYNDFRYPRLFLSSDYTLYFGDSSTSYFGNSALEGGGSNVWVNSITLPPNALGIARSSDPTVAAYPKVRLVKARGICNIGRQHLGYFGGVAGLGQCAAACLQQPGSKGCHVFIYDARCTGRPTDLRCHCSRENTASTFCAEGWRTHDTYNSYAIKTNQAAAGGQFVDAVAEGGLSAMTVFAAPQGTHPVVGSPNVMRSFNEREFVLDAATHATFIAQVQQAAPPSPAPGYIHWGYPRVDTPSAPSDTTNSSQSITFYPWACFGSGLSLHCDHQVTVQNPLSVDGGGSIIARIRVFSEPVNETGSGRILYRAHFDGQKVLGGEHRGANNQENVLAMSQGSNASALLLLAPARIWDPTAIPGAAAGWEVAHTSACANQHCAWSLACADRQNQRPQLAFTEFSTEQGFDFVHVIDVTESTAELPMAVARCARETCTGASQPVFSGSGKAGLDSGNNIPLLANTTSLGLVFRSDNANAEPGRPSSFRALLTCPAPSCLAPARPAHGRVQVLSAANNLSNLALGKGVWASWGCTNCNTVTDGHLCSPSLNNNAATCYRSVSDQLSSNWYPNVNPYSMPPGDAWITVDLGAAYLLEFRFRPTHPHTLLTNRIVSLSHCRNQANATAALLLLLLLT